MRIPGPDDLTPLRQESAAWFEEWLRLGLREYLFEGCGRRAFPGAEIFIEQGEGNIASDLAVIARALSARERDAFNKGLAAALASLDFSVDDDAVIATSLIELGAATAASGLSRVLADKAFSIQNSAAGNKLYQIAFSVAGQMAEIDGQETLVCLRHLVGLPRLFRPEFAGRALIALTKAQPRAFPAHFDSLREPLEARYGTLSYSDPGEERRVRQRHQLLAALIEIIPEPGLLAFPCAPTAHLAREEDSWWPMALADGFPDLLDELAEHAPSEPVPALFGNQSHAPPKLAETATKADMWRYGLALLGLVREGQFVDAAAVSAL